MRKKKDPCKKYACEIQKCLEESSYQEEKCDNAIKRMLSCCYKWREESLCCSGFMKEIQKQERYEQLKNSVEGT